MPLSVGLPLSISLSDDSDILFTDYHDDNNNNTEDDGSISDGAWRTRYLMDHDPLNQLLVCMVCGDLQYSHSLEGVRAHIEEAHPETLNLEAPERRRILEAWDEQVSQRERFFTSQLQQHSGALEGEAPALAFSSHGVETLFRVGVWGAVRLVEYEFLKSRVD